MHYQRGVSRKKFPEMAVRKGTRGPNKLRELFFSSFLAVSLFVDIKSNLFTPSQVTLHMTVCLSDLVSRFLTVASVLGVQKQFFFSPSPEPSVGGPGYRWTLPWARWNHSIHWLSILNLHPNVNVNYTQCSNPHVRFFQQKINTHISSVPFTLHDSLILL